MFLITLPELLLCKSFSVDLNEELPELIAVQLNVVPPL